MGILPSEPLRPPKTMSVGEATKTYLELRVSAPDGSEGAGLSHNAEGLFLYHVLEIAAFGEPRGGLTLVHDAGDHGSRYTEAANGFAEDGWAVALPDQRGHGLSEGPRGHSAGILEVLRDFDSVQDHLAYRLPDAPKVLVGQGLGALHALAYALERPGQLGALVLLSPLWEPSFQLPERVGGLRKLFKKVTEESPGQVGFQADQLSDDSAQAQAWQADEHCHGIVSLRAGEQALEAAGRYPARMSELSLPVLLLHGEDDKLASCTRSRELAGSNVEFQSFPGQRHDLLHGSARTDVLTTIRTWLDNTLPR